MPHYPDEIDYSDKYTDEFYEYRHVHLPKDVYKKIPRAKLLSESVTSTLFRNGERLEFSNRGDGCTTSSTNQSLTSFSSGGPREQIQILGFHQQTLLLPLMSLFID